MTGGVDAALQTGMTLVAGGWGVQGSSVCCGRQCCSPAAQPLLRSDAGPPQDLAGRPRSPCPVPRQMRRKATQRTVTSAGLHVAIGGPSPAAAAAAAAAAGRGEDEGRCPAPAAAAAAPAATAAAVACAAGAKAVLPPRIWMSVKSMHCVRQESGERRRCQPFKRPSCHALRC